MAEKAAKQLLEEQMKKYKKPEEGQSIGEIESNKNGKIKENRKKKFS